MFSCEKLLLFGGPNRTSTAWPVARLLVTDEEQETDEKTRRKSVCVCGVLCSVGHGACYAMVLGKGQYE